MFEELVDRDFVTYDFQHKDLSHVFAVNAPNLTDVFERDRLDTEIFCTGLFASKKGLFTDQMLSELLTSLQAGDAEILYHHAPDQTNFELYGDEIGHQGYEPGQNASGGCSHRLLRHLFSL